MFPVAVSCKIGALERNANRFHVELIVIAYLDNNLNQTSRLMNQPITLLKTKKKTRNKMSTKIADIQLRF